MENIRIEHDTLREVKVPQKAYYGAQTARPIPSLIKNPTPKKFIPSIFNKRPHPLNRPRRLIVVTYITQSHVISSMTKQRLTRRSVVISQSRKIGKFGISSIEFFMCAKHMKGDDFSLS